MQSILSRDEIFARKETFSEQCCVYFLINKDEVIYVGQCHTGITRIANHRSSKKFDSFTMIPCTKSEMDLLEAEYIIMFNPPLNESLPWNKRYMTLEQTRMRLGIEAKLYEKLIKNKTFTPIYKDWYLADEVISVIPEEYWETWTKNTYLPARYKWAK